jgi:iron complex transport system permease protein
MTRNMTRTRPRVVGGLLLVACAAGGVVILGTGDYPIPPLEVIRTLFGAGTPAAEYIVLDLRLPRLLTALAVGAALAASGAIFQSLTRNPLGSPDIIGFTAGASTGALIAIIATGAGVAGVAVGAVGGGVLTAATVYLLAYRRGTHGYRLVIIGVGVQALLVATNNYLLVRGNIWDAQRAAVWLTGSLNARDWSHATVAGAGLAVLLPVAMALSPPCRMLEMGDEAAQALGVAVERTRLALIAVAVGLAAAGTAAAGPVAFVALAAPQLARRLTRATGPGVLPAAAMGAVLLLTSDLIAQRALAPTQLPVGVVTSCLGGGYLVWLLRRGRDG